MSDDIVFAPKWARSRLMPRPSNVIIVAKDGPAHARTISHAMSLVENPSADNPWLIQVMPGTYEEDSFIRLRTGVTIMGVGGIEWQSGQPLVTIKTKGCIDYSSFLLGEGGNLIGVNLDVDANHLDASAIQAVYLTGETTILGCYIHVHGSSDKDAYAIFSKGSGSEGWIVNSYILNEVFGSGDHWGIYNDADGWIKIFQSTIEVSYATAIGVETDNHSSMTQLHHSTVIVPSGQKNAIAGRALYAYDVSWTDSAGFSGTVEEYGLAASDRAGKMPSDMYSRLASGTSGSFHGTDAEVQVNGGIITDITSGSYGGAITNIGARVYRNSSQALASGSEDPISFTAARWDTDNIWDSASPTKFTINTDGVYLIVGNLRFEAHDNGQRQAGIILNGSTYLTIDKALNEGSGGAVDLNPAAVYQLSEGDYVELYAYQNSGVTLNVVRLENCSPEFTIQKVG